MAVLLDIIGSAMMAGILLLLVLKMNLFMSNASHYSDTELKLQQNAKTIAEILNHDLRKIGYKNTGTSIITAQPKRIKYKADMQPPGTAGHGVMDLVEYYLGDSTQVSGTSNPRDKILYRIVNSDTISGPSLGLVDMKFSYLDAKGITTAILDSIKYIRAEFWIEPVEPVNNFITGNKDSVFTYWELTIYPRNI